MLEVRPNQEDSDEDEEEIMREIERIEHKSSNLDKRQRKRFHQTKRSAHEHDDEEDISRELDWIGSLPSDSESQSHDASYMSEKNVDSTDPENHVQMVAHWNEFDPLHLLNPVLRNRNFIPIDQLSRGIRTGDLLNFQNIGSFVVLQAQGIGNCLFQSWMWWMAQRGHRVPESQRILRNIAADGLSKIEDAAILCAGVATEGNVASLLRDISTDRAYVESPAGPNLLAWVYKTPVTVFTLNETVSRYAPPDSTGARDFFLLFHSAGGIRHQSNHYCVLWPIEEVRLPDPSQYFISENEFSVTVKPFQDTSNEYIELTSVPFTLEDLQTQEEWQLLDPSYTRTY